MADDAVRGPDRRGFLKVAAAGVGAAAIGAQGGLAVGATEQKTMPTIQLGRYKVSRLVVGANPVLGFSYVGALMGRFMTDYFTLERIEQLIRRCLDAGINTWQTSAHEKIDKTLDTLRDSGRDVQWIFLAGGSHLDDAKALKEIIKRNKPIAIVHHGGVSDRLWREGKIEQAHDFAKRVHDLGILAGISAHNPAVIRHAEEKGWDVDLYMNCFYCITRTHDELKKELRQVPVWGKFLPADPARMCEVVRAVKRPCFGFKILAGGRLCNRPQEVEQAFKFAFRHIKPTDGVIVGMFPRFNDEPAQDAALTRRFSHLSR